MAANTINKTQTRDPQGHTRKAYLGIRNMLFHSEIVPGQKISYRDLAERLGMSQTPVIQALKWLEFQQLVPAHSLPGTDVDLSLPELFPFPVYLLNLPTLYYLSQSHKFVFFL